MAHRYPKEKRVKRVFRLTASTKGMPPRNKKKIKKNTRPKKVDRYSKIDKVEDLITMRVYRYYKMHRKSQEKVNYVDWKPKIKKFLKSMQEHILENESGVFIKNLGYFFILRHNALSFRVTKGKISGEGRKYTPVFVPMRKDNLLDTWSMDYAFNHTVYSKTYKKIDAGYKYRMAYCILHNLYTNSNQEIFLIKK